MGTRHLILVQVDNEYKVAQYGQWDGYLSGQGASILCFLKNEMELDKFRENVRLCREATNDDHVSLCEAAGVDPNKEWITFEESERLERVAPHLHRNTGSGILRLVQDNPLPLQLDTLFAANSLYCEYAYVIDLDRKTFEIYTGFNIDPLAKQERFFGLGGPDENGYYPVKHLKTYTLDRLPSEVELVALDKD